MLVVCRILFVSSLGSSWGPCGWPKSCSPVNQTMESTHLPFRFVKRDVSSAENSLFLSAFHFLYILLLTEARCLPGDASGVSFALPSLSLCSSLFVCSCSAVLWIHTLCLHCALCLYLSDAIVEFDLGLGAFVTVYLYTSVYECRHLNIYFLLFGTSLQHWDTG